MTDRLIRTRTLAVLRSKTLMFYVVIWAIPFAVIGLLLAVTACSAGTPTSSTPSHPTTQSLAQRVDQAVAGDGTPLDLSGNSTALGYYPDAYALIKSDCDTMTSQTSGAAQWLAQHLGSSYAVSGEQAALAVGVPLVCPSFTQALTDSQSIAPVGVEKWTAQDTQFVTDVEAHVHDMVLDPQHPVADSWMLLAYTTIACAALANGQSPAEAAQGLMANTPWPNDGLAVVEAAQVDLCTGGGQ